MTLHAGDTALEQPRQDAGARLGAVRRSLIGRLLLSASATAVLQLSSNVMSFALAILLARLLGGEGYGRYVLAFTWANFLITPAVLGLDRFLVRGVAVYEVRSDWARMRGLLRRTNQIVTATSSAIAIAAMVAGVLLLPSSLTTPFCVAMLLVPITALTLVRQGAMQAFGRVVSGQLPEYLIRPLLIIFGVIALHYMGGHALTPTTALAANVVGVAVAFVVGALLLRRALPAVLRAVKPAFATREWLRASVPMMMITGIWTANSYAATLLVGALANPRSAGIYSATQKGGELIVILLVAANMPLAPAVAKLHAQNDRKGLERTAEGMARATFLVSVPLAAIFIIAPNLYLDLFGNGFRAGATALVILAFAQLFNAAAGPSGTVLIMTGHERAAMRGVGAGLLANIVVAVMLVPFLGVTGGAIAFSTSLLLWNTVLVLLVRRRLGVNVTVIPRLSLQRRTPPRSDVASSPPPA